MTADMAAKNIDTPIAAHIHRGGRTVAGDVVQPLEQPADGDPGASAACIDVDATLARKIKRHPRRYYVNVHTEDFPGGAVRGQLPTQTPPSTESTTTTAAPTTTGSAGAGAATRPS